MSRLAFTLIELLVVIAIIAILAALLLPVLNGAKNESAKATDLSNFHQLMAAIHLYTSDNHDSLTWPNWDYGRPMPNGTTPAGWLYQINPSASGPAAFDGRAGLLWSTLHGGKVLFCPMDNPAESYPPDKNGNETSRAEQLSSYIMNGAVIGYRSGYHSNSPPVKISQMNPEDCLFWEGDDRAAFSFNDGSSWPVEGVIQWALPGPLSAAQPTISATPTGAGRQAIPIRTASGAFRQPPMAVTLSMAMTVDGPKKLLIV